MGVVGLAFGETIPTQTYLDNTVWPRLLAIAEHGWTEGDWEQYNGSNPAGLQQDFDVYVYYILYM